MCKDIVYIFMIKQRHKIRKESKFMPWEEEVIVTMREEFAKRDYLLFIDFAICYRILPAFIN